MGLDSVWVRGPRRRGKGMKCVLLGLLLGSGLFLAAFVVIFRGLWEGLFLDGLGGGLASDEENRGVVMATRVKTGEKTATKTTGVAGSWEKEDPEIDGIEVVPLNPESTSSVPEKPIVEPLKDSQAAQENATELTNSSWVPVYNDPFNISRTIFYGPWRAEIPSEVFAGESFKLVFHCEAADHSLCPEYYLVMFHGVTRQTIPPPNFKVSPSSINPPHSWSVVEATWTINDPGEYSVYAYPEFQYMRDTQRLYCKLWKETMTYPWHQAAVQNCPIHLSVKRKPNTYPPEEGYGICSEKDLKTARYLSTNPLDSSKRFAALYENTKRSFIWAPYTCKIPHRSIDQAIAAIPSAKHIVLIGDSTLRGPFCTRIWENLHGTVHDSVCDYKQHNQTYYEQKWGHKFTWREFQDESSQTGKRNVSFSFLWSPVWFYGRGLPELLKMDPAPTHVVFNMGLWLSWHNPDKLREEYWEFLENMKEHFAGKVKHIIMRTTVSVVQAVNCFGDKHFMYENQKDQFPDGPPRDSVDFRIGGCEKRKAMFFVAHHWNQMHKDNPPFKLSVIDAWEYTDNRPEATSEGRHWVSEDEGAQSIRPHVGETDDSILDRVWDDFIHERVTTEALKD